MAVFGLVGVTGGGGVIDTGGVTGAGGVIDAGGVTVGGGVVMGLLSSFGRVCTGTIF